MNALLISLCHYCFSQVTDDKEAEFFCKCLLSSFGDFYFPNVLLVVTFAVPISVIVAVVVDVIMCQIPKRNLKYYMQGFVYLSKNGSQHLLWMFCFVEFEGRPFHSP